MKSKEKEHRDDLDQIIQKTQICHLACSRNDEPYVVPLSFGYDGEAVYFHTAQEGKKIEFLKSNPLVCLSFEHSIKIQPNPDLACKWSFAFSSVIITGTAEELSAPQGKLEGLKQIMFHYSNRDWDIPLEELSKTKVWKVIIHTISGKKSPPAQDFNKT